MSESSEFAGEDGPSGVPLKMPPSLVPTRLRLGLFYRTGTQDPRAKPDPAFFKGDDLRRYKNLKK